MQFLDGEIQNANRYINRCSDILLFGEMQTKQD